MKPFPLIVAITSPQIVFASFLVFRATGDFTEGSLIAEALVAVGIAMVIGVVVLCTVLTFINSGRPCVVAYLVRIAVIWVILNILALIASLTAYTGLATISAASLLVSILVLAASATNSWANSLKKNFL